MSEVSAPLEVRNVVVHYPAREFARRNTRLQAVRGVSFEVGNGEVYGVVGESGCGKTSLARAIVGLVPLESGSIRFRGVPVARPGTPVARSARREVQYLFQDSSAALSPRRTILQSLREPVALYHLDGQSELRIERALETVQLTSDVLGRYPHELSGGQRQRVALARALLAEPALLVADEPLSSQDVSVQAHLISLLRNLREQKNIAILLISHDLAVVGNLADRVGIMYLGEMMETGPTATVLRHPAHPYTRALRSAAVQAPHQQLAGNRDDFELNVLQGETPSALTPPAGCVFHTRCPEVMERCRTEVPSVTGFHAVSGQTHTVRCHLCES